MSYRVGSSTVLERADWGARAPKGTGNALNAKPDGVTIHWEGPPMGSRPHSACGALVRSIQAFHMGSQRGWADIAYSLLVCEHGIIFIGRGKGKGSAANGTTDGNRRRYAICALVGKGDPMPGALLDGIHDAVALCVSWGAKNAVNGHRDWLATECPGQALYDLVKAGRFGAGAGASPIQPSKPTNPAPKPGGKKAPSFPLQRGWYFGPSTGPMASVSGYYNHLANGRTGHPGLVAWQKQMQARGWTISADGLYGKQTHDVALAFQREKGLDRDGLIGRETWDAAWQEPVT